MVNVFDGEEVVGQVSENTNLDYWDGNNHTCGSTGRHKGLTVLQDGRYVLIHSSQWQGERDNAEVITAETALREILVSGNEELFKDFPELEKLKEKTLMKEAHRSEKAKG